MVNKHMRTPSLKDFHCHLKKFQIKTSRNINIYARKFKKVRYVSYIYIFKCEGYISTDSYFEIFIASVYVKIIRWSEYRG